MLLNLVFNYLLVVLVVLFSVTLWFIRWYKSCVYLIGLDKFDRINYNDILNSIKMVKRKTYHVTKTDDGWQGKVEKGKRASVKGDTKKEVVKKTIEIAKKNENSSVIIHKTDGKFQEERTYPKGSDPYPPEG